jgi:uncharacterized protein (DUF2252 family)
MPHPDPSSRKAIGRAARKAVPRGTHAEVPTPRTERDPVAILRGQDAARVADLVPIRYGRMLVSPFTFYRGAAKIMATDLAAGPSSGLTVQLCGDAHLSNFGAFGSPERRLVFDLNDFDETLPGPFEWDVKRLAASIEIAGRDRGLGGAQRRAAVAATAAQYRQVMADLAGRKELEVWYAHLDVESALAEMEQELSPAARKRSAKSVAAARAKDSMRAFAKLTEVVDGERRIVSDPPLVVPLRELLAPELAGRLRDEMHLVVDGYRSTLADDRRHLFDQYELVDIARKVVGVGSVGTRAWILLFLGRDESDPLFLQAKEAGPSVLEDHLGASIYDQAGQRVVAGQRLMQTTSDIFLGWQRMTADRSADGAPHDYYIRQLADWKGSARVDRMDADALTRYGQLCGWTLARAHARSGDRIAIAGYLGSSDSFDQAIAGFAATYADGNELDHARLTAAAEAGDIPYADG